MTNLLRIGELASKLNITTKTLRFYEKIGLIEHPGRSESGYRLYNEDQASQVFVVVNLRRIGLSIDELQQLKDNADKGSLRKSLSSILDQKLFTIDQDLGVLQGKREDLAARLQALVCTPRERPSNCICDLLLIDCTCGTVSEK
jgi:MerR family Zn(II)-responsive transcriptional regulator of zntA